ncbi:MAG: hypothetical protein AB7T06_02260 [Kofleriaceae bacterium]
MRWLVAAALCAGCYRPGADPACSIACVAGVPDNCPAGLECIGGVCGGTSACSDAMVGDMEMVDSSISETDAGFCVGTNMPLQVCLGGMPTNDLTVLTRTTFDTTSCASRLFHQGVELCVYAYRDVAIANTLQFIGTRPAVIVAAGTVSIETGATITVAAAPPALVPGAGHDPTNCTAPPSGGMSTSQMGGGGGGAGGSFGSAGGNGGNGSSGSGALAGPQTSAPYLALRGGCSGSRGGKCERS